MITCFSAVIARLAMEVSATDCISQSLLASRMTMRLAYRIRNGEASIDTTMLASTGATQRSGSTWWSVPSVSSTKPNSPACARYRPVRSATPGAPPNRRASPATRAALASTGTVVNTITSTHSSASTCQSSFMPMVMKNRPSSTSWNGRMSVSTWCLYSVSAISMPATNAPSASDRPASSVIAAMPKVTPSRLNMNSSSLLRREIAVSHQRITFWPPDSSTASTTTALMTAGTSVASRLPVLPPSAGMITSSGTTARSWNSSTPITRRPCSLSSSSRSAISLTTSAVLDIAIALPSTAAPCQLRSQWRPSSVKPQINARLPPIAPRMVSTTCDAPRPNTSVRMARSLGRLNSSPITNIRNTTPNSASERTPAVSCASSSALGPMMTPATR